MLQTNFVEKMKTHFMFNKYFSPNCAVHENTWKKYYRAQQATDNNVAHIRCVLDT
jgi:hypothetical protein